jgi:predicted ATPase
MLLYIWINNFRNISRTGFNLSSRYNFTFEENEKKTISNGIEGELKCEILDSVSIFPDNIIDFKVIIGENGAGKTSVLDALINNLMTEHNRNFDGFIVTDKSIIFRDNSKIKYSNDKLKLDLIADIDIVNYKLPGYKQKRDKDYPIRLVESYLKNNLVFYYSPLLNFDKVMDFEGVGGMNDAFEYYEKYINLSIENQIIRDYKNNINQPNQYRLNGVSELLNFKIFETKRYLDFLFNFQIGKEFIFTNKIEKIRFRMNTFYDIYWETIDDYLKTDTQTLGSIKRVTSFINEKAKSNNYGFTDLKSNLYRQFIYCVIKFEYDYRWSIKNTDGSNALIDTLRTFIDATKGKRTPQTILASFLKQTLFNKKTKINIKTFDNIIKFITDNHKIKTLYEDCFEIEIHEVETINELFRLFYENENFKTEHKYYLCNFILIEFDGLSNGEKNLLSLFSRFYSSSKYYNFKNKELILLLDEPEVGLHPQWQTEFISILTSFLTKLFPNNKIQILLTTHSPILLSDFPPNHVIYLKKNHETGKCQVDNIQNSNSTFAANIHSLYSNAFFLKDKGAAMGNVAKSYINKLIQDIKEKEKSKEELIALIEPIGEPLIKDQLKNLLDENYPSFQGNIKNIDQYIQSLENTLLEAKKIKADLNENSNKS